MLILTENPLSTVQVSWKLLEELAKIKFIQVALFGFLKLVFCSRMFLKWSMFT